MADIHIKQIPQELKDLIQWCVWRNEMTDEGFAKRPYNAHNPQERAKVNDERTWSPFQTAIKTYTDLDGTEFEFSGIGFFLKDFGGYTFIDLDKCIDNDGNIADWARAIVDALDSYTEFSHSGRGLHIIIRGHLPVGQRRKGGVEFYDEGRYAAFTGRVFENRFEIQDRQAELNAVYQKEFPDEVIDETITGTYTNADTNIRDEDMKLIEEIQKSKQGEKFNRLFYGQWEGSYASQSEADMAFATILAFWTKKDPEQMNRIFRRSALYREKWDKKHAADGMTYGQVTIGKALKVQKEQRQDKIKVDIGRFKKKSEHVNGEADFVEEQTSLHPDNIINFDAFDEPVAPDTHYANAYRLARFHGHEMVFVEGVGWFVYNGKHWVESDVEAIRIANGVAQYVLSEAGVARALCDKFKKEGNEKEAQSYDQLANRLVKWARSCEMGSHTRDTLYKAESLFSVPMSEMDKDPLLFAVDNGVIDLRTHKFRAHSSRDFISAISTTAFEVGATCPRWMQFLDEVFGGDAEVIEYVQKIFGYCLSGLTVEQKWFFLYGAGGNGKSKFTDTLKELLGKHYATHTTPDFMQEGDRHLTEIADLRGKRVAITSEAEQGKKFASKRIKELTGEEVIKARKMRQDPSEMRIQFKLFLTGNHRPATKDLTNAFWRRVKIIPFNVPFEGTGKEDRFLMDKLRAEMSGILNWALEGYKKWEKDGLKDPAAVRETVEEYKQEVDSVARFVNEKVERKIGNKERLITVYEAYKNYCQAHEDINDDEIVNLKEFLSRILLQKFSIVRLKGYRVINHISIKDLFE